MTRLPAMFTVLVAFLTVACGGPPEALPTPPVPTPRQPLRAFIIAPRPACSEAVWAAVKSGRPAEVARVAAAGGRFNCGDREKPTPLSLAVQADAPEMVRALLGAGADPNARWSFWGDRLPLQDAIESSGFGYPSTHRVEIVTLLLQSGANPNARWCPFESRHMLPPSLPCTSEDGVTPLMAATWEDQTEVVSLLLRAGADPALLDWSGDTPLEYVRSRATADVLLSAVFPTADSPNAAALEAMAEWRPVGGFRNPGHQTLLGSAMAGYTWAFPPSPPPRFPGETSKNTRHLDRMRLLLEMGADPNQRAALSGVDWPPLALAIGRVDELLLLLEHGANPNVRWCVPVDGSRGMHARHPAPGCTLATGTTPLMFAAARGETASIVALLQHGADRAATDWTGRTALDYARAGGHQDIVAVLTRRRGDGR